ncbi:arylalkylamine N-acetyltransferase 1-like [Mercenaria mercenaria]|uniref:arylalkylamine N-acetyltransferase 1-like n=1 Tax=Mercenaria mercenaria TaxID=6596 RepID=UPI00234FA91A|nr:arylalkylamine N-acetyltransferase 1-like [Mercenaria mercenaria]
MENHKGTCLMGLSKESIEKAFKKVTPDNLPEELELKLLTNDMQNDAVLFMKQNFVAHEPLIHLFDVQWDEDTEKYWRAVFDHGMTLVLTSKIRGEIISIRAIDIVRKTDKVKTTNVADERLRNLLEYLNYCDDNANFFEHYGTDAAVHFSGLAVSESYRRRGIATLLLKCAVELIETLGLESVHIKGEASSDYSKKIYEKFGFEMLFEQMYEDYRVNGKQVISNIGVHKTNKIYGKTVTCLK